MGSLKTYLRNVVKCSAKPTELKNREPISNENTKDEPKMDTIKQKREMSQIKIRLPKKEVPFFESNNVTLIDR